MRTKQSITCSLTLGGFLVNILLSGDKMSTFIDDSAAECCASLFHKQFQVRYRSIAVNCVLVTFWGGSPGSGVGIAYIACTREMSR